MTKKLFGFTVHEADSDERSSVDFAVPFNIGRIQRQLHEILSQFNGKTIYIEIFGFTTEAEEGTEEFTMDMYNYETLSKIDDELLLQIIDFLVHYQGTTLMYKIHRHKNNPVITIHFKFLPLDGDIYYSEDPNNIFKITFDQLLIEEKAFWNSAKNLGNQHRDN